MDWRQLANWEERPDNIVDRAGEKVQKLLKAAETPPLAAEVQKELDRLMSAAVNQFA